MANALYHLKGSNGTGPAAMQIDFTTDNGSSDSNAKAVAQSLSTLFAINVTLYDATGTVVINSYTPGSQGSTVSSPATVVTNSAA